MTMTAKIALIAATVLLWLGLSVAPSRAETVLMENKYLKVTKTADGKGVTLTSKVGGSSADVYPVDAAGNPKGTLGKSTMKLDEAKHALEITGGAEAVEVRVKARFSFIPEFHGDDMLYDPTVCKPDTLYVPAEHFLISVPEGGKCGVALMWPRGGKQAPILIAEGEGAARRFTKTRVVLNGKGIYIAIMDHKDGLFPYIENLSADKLTYNLPVRQEYKGLFYAEVKSGWKFPFAGGWWAIVAKPQTLVMPEHGRNKAGGPIFAATVKERNEPVGGMPSSSYVAHKFRGGWDDVLKTYQKVNGTGAPGSEWMLHLEERFGPYHAALLYPKTRTRASYRTMGTTPPDAMTFAELLIETLGKKEAFAVVDYDGISRWVGHGGRGTGIPKGQPKIDATCAGWGVLPKTIKTNKAKYMERTQACYNFCFYNKVRIDEYLKMAKDVITFCKDTSKKNPKLKDLAERVAKAAEYADKLWEEENTSFRGRVLKSVGSKSRYGGKWFNFLSKEDAEKVCLDADFFKKIKEHFVKCFDDPEGKKKISRSQWTDTGGTLDGIVAGERAVAIYIRQEASLSGVRTPEEREWAFKIREMTQKALRFPHDKEGARYTLRYDWHINVSKK